jgi:hypothetical protein
MAGNQWIVTSPISFPATLICSKNFSPITIRSSSTITIPAGCRITLKSHIIQPDSATTDSDLETIHYEWFYYSNELFPKYHIEQFETRVAHLQNLTAASINSIRASVEESRFRSASDNRTVEDYFIELEQFKNNNPEHIT